MLACWFYQQLDPFKFSESIILTAEDHKTFATISDFFRSIQIEIEQDFDFTIHSLDRLHGEPPTQSPLFRTNYYAFLLIESGKGHYTIDDQTFPLSPFAYYFTNPGHLKSFFIEENIEGYMMTFSESFLKETYPLTVESEFPFLFQETTPVMDLPADIFNDMKSCFALLRKEYDGHSPYKKRIVGGQLAAILFKTKELLIKYKTRLQALSRAAAITDAFRKLLSKNLLEVMSKKTDQIWNVQDYAQLLHLHPNYLSQTIKSETGKTVKQWVDEKVHAEARTLLKHTNKTIAEIAFDLSFTDTSNFSRFFKKMEGLSPGQFRKS